MTKYISFIILIFFIFTNNKSYSLNIFEITAIALGTVSAYNLYFDNSLPYGQSHWYPASDKNTYQKKMNLMKNKKNSFKIENPKISSRSDMIRYLYKLESLHRKKYIFK